MSQFEKLWDRFLLVPSDFTYDELRKIMKHYGYSENNKRENIWFSSSIYKEG